MLIKNCMLIDGADIFEEMKDIRIVNGKIKEVADCLMPEGDEEIATPATQTQGAGKPHWRHLCGLKDCRGVQGKTDHKARGGLPLRAHQRAQETVRRKEPGTPDETGFRGHDPGYPF